MAQRVARGIALLFHDRGTRKGVSGQHHGPAALYPGKDPVPILQGAGWAPGPVWMGGKSRTHRDSILDCPARSSVAVTTDLPGPLPTLSTIEIYQTVFGIKRVDEHYCYTLFQELYTKRQ